MSDHADIIREGLRHLGPFRGGAGERRGRVKPYNRYPPPSSGRMWVYAALLAAALILNLAHQGGVF